MMASLCDRSRLPCGRSPGTGGLVSPGLVPLQGGPPGANVRFPLGLGHRQEMRIKKSQRTY